jgi:hypothetical protein
MLAFPGAARESVFRADVVGYARASSVALGGQVRYLRDVARGGAL